jgi:CheY-like chemotaxis protein
MKKILIVDDSPQGLIVLRLALTRPGVTVLEANSGRVALDVHKRENVDVIVLDMSMPALDGEEVARKLRADPALRDVSILIFADNAREATRARCMAAGANDFIGKPFQPAELQARVQQLLDVAARKNTQLLTQVEVRGGGASVAPFIGRILNLSATGLLLETEAPLDKGHELALTFFVPGSQTQTRASARVVRRTAGDGAPRWGLRFTMLDEAGRRSLMEWVGRTGAPGHARPPT